MIKLRDIPASSGIYRITCTITGKFYIGSAVSLRRRWKEHRGELRRNIHRNPKLQNAFNKYGEDAFLFEVWELVLIPELLTAREQYWLDKLKPYKREKGFNIAKVAGSALGLKRSPETIAKKRIASLGRKHSKETCELMRSLRISRGTTPEQKEHIRNVQPSAAEARRRNLIAISPDGTEYAVHGICKFCEEHHLQPSCLILVARGIRKHTQGWKARFP